MDGKSKIIKELDFAKDKLIEVQFLLAQHQQKDEEIGKKIVEIHNLIIKIQQA